MANNEILQIVVFSVFFGVALRGAAASAPSRAGADRGAVATSCCKVTGYVMMFAPLAVFAAMAATVATNGLGILREATPSSSASFYFGLMLLWVLLVVVGFLVLGPRVISSCCALIREPLLLAFSTASSEAAYPKMLEGLDKFGVSRKISSFVLPLGYSFNLDGTMMYCTFATVHRAGLRHRAVARHADRRCC